MNNKVALITGASKGIGRQVAIQLASDGFDVVVNYRGSETLALETVSLCQGYGVQSMALYADVSKHQEVILMVTKIVETFGRIDVLVNNAGITKDGLVLRMQEEDFNQVIDINLKGSFLVAKEASKIMIKQREGVIVNMSSIIGCIGNAGQVNYAASKAGILGMSKALARELAPRNIRVNAIAPGFIETEMTKVLNQATKDKILDQIPMKGFGTMQDVADMVAFLVSEKSRYITGQVLHVDGGMYM